jgi:cbb3-type cytochrome oxidase maturation protein
MIVILLLIPLSIVIAIGFLAAFIWAVRSGQYEDTCTPSMRLLMEEKRGPTDPSGKMTSADAQASKNQSKAKDE